PLRFGELYVSLRVAEQQVVINDAAGVFHFREILFHRRRDSRIRRCRLPHQFTLFILIQPDADDLRGVFLKRVKTPLTRYILKYQQTAGDADTKPENIKGGVSLSFQKVTQADGEIIFYHGLVHWFNCSLVHLSGSMAVAASSALSDFRLSSIHPSNI